MNSLTVAAVVQDGKIRIVDEDFYRTRAARMAKQWGDGASLTVRIEPEDEAIKYGQLKYWHGYVLQPLVEYTGDHDWRVYLKLMFLPDGKTSLTQLTYDEMRAFTEQTEAWAHEMCAEAYEQHGKEYVA